MSDQRGNWNLMYVTDEQAREWLPQLMDEITRLKLETRRLKVTVAILLAAVAWLMFS